MSDPDLSTQMKRHLWLAEKPITNKLVGPKGGLITYIDEALWDITNDCLCKYTLDEDFDWKPYIEHPKPKWYEVAKQGTLLITNVGVAVFSHFSCVSGRVMIYDMNGNNYHQTLCSPAPSAKIRSHLGLSEWLEKQGVS